MSKIADPLRERILRMDELGYDERAPMLMQTLSACADQIDAEHERRMEQCRHETKRAALRYLRSVMEDYLRHGVKRTRSDAMPRNWRKGKYYDNDADKWRERT